MSRQLIEIIKPNLGNRDTTVVPGRVDIFKFTCVPVSRPVLKITTNREITEEEIMAGAFYTGALASNLGVPAVSGEHGLLANLCLAEAVLSGVLMVISGIRVAGGIEKVRFLGKDILGNFK